MAKKKRHILPIIIVVLILAALTLGYLYHFTDVLNDFKEKYIEKTESTDSSTDVDKNETVSSADSDKKTGETDKNDDTKKTDDSAAKGADMSQLMEMYMAQLSQQEPVGNLDLPQSSSQMSFTLAKQALALCSGGNKSGQATLLMNDGFEIVLQDGYDKSDESIAHTCAFTVAKKTIDYFGQAKTLLIVAIRGTNAGEWFSNFNFADSQSSFTEYAENFLQAAESINLKLIPIIKENPDPVILVCGHSRGAAAANLLGMTLDELRGPEGIYVYTFATPNTYRGSEKDGQLLYTNIFNFINPADVVTEVPLKQMGFHHIGVDIVLPCEPETAERIASEMDVMYQAAPTVKKYYTERHSLTAAGKDSKGLTGYEIMQALASSMTGIKSDVNGRLNMKDIYKIMDGSPTSSESDFAPLIELLEKVIPRDGSFGSSVLMQHMPMVYQGLIDAYSQIYEAMGAIPDGQMPEGFDMGAYQGMGDMSFEGMGDMSFEGMEGMSPEDIAALMQQYGGEDADN